MTAACIAIAAIVKSSVVFFGSRARGAAMLAIEKRRARISSEERVAARARGWARCVLKTRVAMTSSRVECRTAAVRERGRCRERV